MYLVEFVADVIGPAKAADRRGRGIFAERLVETLDAVGKQIKPETSSSTRSMRCRSLSMISSAASTSLNRSVDAVERAPRASIRKDAAITSIERGGGDQRAGSGRCRIGR